MLRVLQIWLVGILSSWLWCPFDTAVLVFEHLAQYDVLNSLSFPLFYPGISHFSKEPIQLALKLFNYDKYGPSFETEDLKKKSSISTKWNEIDSLNHTS